jgi:hypothetical protein
MLVFRGYYENNGKKSDFLGKNSIFCKNLISWSPILLHFINYARFFGAFLQFFCFSNSSNFSFLEIIDIPTLATIQSSTELYNTLDSLCRDVERVKIEKIYRFRETGLEDEEHKENIEKLHELKEKYEDNIHL